MNDGITGAEREKGKEETFKEIMPESFKISVRHEITDLGSSENTKKMNVLLPHLLPFKGNYK